MRAPRQRKSGVPRLWGWPGPDVAGGLCLKLPLSVRYRITARQRGVSGPGSISAITIPRTTSGMPGLSTLCNDRTDGFRMDCWRASALRTSNCEEARNAACSRGTIGLASPVSAASHLPEVGDPDRVACSLEPLVEPRLLRRLPLGFERPEKRSRQPPRR